MEAMSLGFTSFKLPAGTPSITTKGSALLIVPVPRILIHSSPRTGLEAKFSGEYAAAAALAHGRVGIATFTDDAVMDPAVRRLMERVRVVVDPELPTDSERQMRSRLTVRLADGSQIEIGPRPVPGHPTHPMTVEALREKF